MVVHYGSRVARVLLPKRYVAITISRHVLTPRPCLDERTLRHEAAHVEQWRRFGWFGFVSRYLWYHLRYGYSANPFEVEARRAESPKQETGTRFRHENKGGRLSGKPDASRRC